MTLNFQNKIVFPAPETSYTTQSAFGQVIYIPRNIMKQVDRKFSDKRAPLLSGLKSATDKQSSSSSLANTSATTSENSQKINRAG